MVQVLTRAELPILDYDDDPFDPISHGMLSVSDLRLPERAVVTLLGPLTDRWAAGRGFEQVDKVTMITRDFPIWVGRHGSDRGVNGGVNGEGGGEGFDVTLVEIPVGAPAATIVFEYLLLFGVRTVVAAGSCGGLIHFDEGEFVLPTRALRDEGTSYHYLPASRWVPTDDGVRAACAAAIDAAGMTYAECATWTTDAFLRETPAVIAARREEDCQVVEMECAALAAVARFRGARFAQILFTADTLATGEHDQRSWGKAARPAALRLALDAVTRVPSRG